MASSPFPPFIPLLLYPFLLVLLLSLLTVTPVHGDSNCLAPGDLDQDYLFMTDMMGKSTFDLGNYDNCQSNPVAQYCLMISSSVQFGICIPSDCTMPQDALNSTTKILSFLLAQIEFLVLLAPEDAIYYCGDNAVTWSSVSFAPLVILCTLIAGLVGLILIGTLLDWTTSDHYSTIGRCSTFRTMCCSHRGASDNYDNDEEQEYNVLDDDNRSTFSSSIGGGNGSIIGKKRKFITTKNGTTTTTTNNNHQHNPSYDNTSISNDPLLPENNKGNTSDGTGVVSSIPHPPSRRQPDTLYYSSDENDDDDYSPTHRFRKPLDYTRNNNPTTNTTVVSPFNYLNNVSTPTNGIPIGSPLSSSSTPSFLTGTTIPRTRSAWQQRNNITIEPPSVLSSSSSSQGIDKTVIPTISDTVPLPPTVTTVELPANSFTNSNNNTGTTMTTVPPLTVTIPTTNTDAHRNSSHSRSSGHTPMPKTTNGTTASSVTRKPSRLPPSSSSSVHYITQSSSSSSRTCGYFLRKLLLFFSLRRNWYALWDQPLPIVSDRTKKDRILRRHNCANSTTLRSHRSSQSQSVTASSLKPLTPSFRTGTQSLITHTNDDPSSPSRKIPLQRSTLTPSADSDPDYSRPSLFPTPSSPYRTDDSDRKPQRRTAIIDGVRAFSILYIILGNTLYFMLTPGFANWNQVAPPNGIMSTWFFQIFPSSTFAADTFLLLSGFCATTSLLSLAEIAAGGGIEGPNERTNEALPALRGNHATLGAYSVNRSFGLTIQSTVVYVFRRFIRTWPLYAFIVGFYTLIFPLLGSGPFWWSLQSYTSACYNYWWSNLVYLNNVYPSTNSLENSCMPWTWYIAVDTQLYLIVPILLFLYLRQPSLGITAVTVLIVASIVAAEEIVSVGNISAIIDFYIQLGQMGPSQEEINYNDQYSVRMWTRAPPFLLGILLTLTLDRVGTARQRYFAAARQWELAAATGNTLGIQTYVGMHSGLSNSVMLPPNSLNMVPPHTYGKRTQYILLGCGILLIGLCMFSSVTAYSQVPNPWSMEDQVSYTILTRPAWSLGVALILFTSLSQDSEGGWIGSILSLPLWRPIAKLSYALFLVHPLWMQLIYYTRTQYFRYSALMIIQWICSNIFISGVLALSVYLMIELPCNRGLEYLGYRLYHYLPTLRKYIVERTRSIAQPNEGRKYMNGSEGGNEYLLGLHDGHQRTSSASSENGSKQGRNGCARMIVYILDWCGEYGRRRSRHDTYTTATEQPMNTMNNPDHTHRNGGGLMHPSVMNGWSTHNNQDNNNNNIRESSRSDSFGSTITFGSVLVNNNSHHNGGNNNNRSFPKTMGYSING